MNKLVIFDFDGCLVHTLDAWMKSVEDTLREYGIYPSRDEMIHVLSTRSGASIFGIDDEDALWNKLRLRFRENFDMVFINEGVIDVMDNLIDKNISRAILTRSKKELIDLFFSRHPSFGQLFNSVVTRDDVAHEKPHPEGVEKLISQFNIKKQNTYIVGDTSHDLEAGRAVGAKTILYYPPHNKAFYNEGTVSDLKWDYVIHHFNDLISIVVE